jgi:hypothetical protein
MSRLKLAFIALTLALAASMAQAQPVVQPTAPNYTPPVLNPYLNLLRGGNPAINYLGLVRPQMQQAQQLQMLQNGLAHTTAEAEAAALAPTTPTGVLADTGHTVGFMTYTRYFNTTAPRGR